MMGKRLIMMGMLVVVLFAFTLFGVAQDNQEDAIVINPTPIVFPPPNQSVYPELICPYFAEVQSGYSWQGITIGESTKNELETVLSELGNYEVVYRQEDSLSNAIRYMWNGPKTQAEGQQVPTMVDVCLQNGAIMVMEVNWSSQPFPITDLIVNFGIPDVVTWSWTENRRVAFWFEQGIASEVFTQLGDEVSFGLVIRLIYFPPQSPEGYEERWPFSVTQMQPFHPVDPSIPSEQNPFDFEAMVATMTAQPSRTPMATATP